jgi:hypothetical protein
MLQTAPLHRLYRAAGQRSCRRWRAGRERPNPLTQAGEIIECEQITLLVAIISSPNA